LKQRRDNPCADRWMAIELQEIIMKVLKESGL
jgi:hypothetical protein